MTGKVEVFAMTMQDELIRASKADRKANEQAAESVRSLVASGGPSGGELTLRDRSGRSITLPLTVSAAKAAAAVIEMLGTGNDVLITSQESQVLPEKQIIRDDFPFRHPGTSLGYLTASKIFEAGDQKSIVKKSG